MTEDILTNFLQKTFDELKDNNEGKVQDYIKKLAEASPNLFGISICDTHGNVYSIGDSKHKFSIQSCSKVITYCIARSMHDLEFIHKHVGFEPSGNKFNAHVLKDGIPHNPMINSGAIVISHLIKQDKKISECVGVIDDYYKKLIGNTDKYGEIGFDTSVFHSEKEKSDRNKSLSFFMNEEGKAFTKDMDDTEIKDLLEFYYHNCAISINAELGSIICATLANNGICPINNEKVFDKKITEDVQQLMKTCGMYDSSGTFFFKVGLPAKSGVSGCIFLVIPNKMGICIFSPLTDESGNSIKGVKFCEKLVEEKIHIKFKSTDTDIPDDMMIYRLIEFAGKNKLDKIKQLYEKQKQKGKEIDLNQSDYDKRTMLHLASANCNWEIIRFLMKHNANQSLKDSNGMYPIDCIPKKTDIPKDILDYLENIDDD